MIFDGEFRKMWKAAVARLIVRQTYCTDRFLVRLVGAMRSVKVIGTVGLKVENRVKYFLNTDW
jgi:hypothetical protein